MIQITPAEHGIEDIRIDGQSLETAGLHAVRAFKAGWLPQNIDERFMSMTSRPRMARANGLTFTRYYDDLCLSGGSRTPRLARVVENILAAHRLEISISKRHDWGPTNPHTVTKVMVNTSPSPLPEYVNSVQGLINAHRRGVKVLDATELLSLRGQVAYVNFVNPVAGSALLKLLDSPTQMGGISTG